MQLNYQRALEFQRDKLRRAEQLRLIRRLQARNLRRSDGGFALLGKRFRPKPAH